MSTGRDNPVPTTGAPPDFNWAPGCRCYYREDPEYGDLLTAPSGGCPVHSCTCLSYALGRGHSESCIHIRLNPFDPGPADAPVQIIDALHKAGEAWRDGYRLTPVEVVLPDWYWQLPNTPEPPHTAMGVRYTPAHPDPGPVPRQQP